MGMDNLVSITLILVQVKHMLMEVRVEQVPEAPLEIIVLVMVDLEVVPLLVIGRVWRWLELVVVIQVEVVVYIRGIQGHLLVVVVDPLLALMAHQLFLRSVHGKARRRRQV